VAFTVVNSVRASKDDIPSVIVDVQRMGLDVYRSMPGFRLGRLLVSEDGTEAALVLEWESRDHYMAYRQSEIGRRLVQGAAHLHPHISFYEVIASYDTGNGS
jgi:heme-degrading monooxygenase HmoA